MSSEGPKKGYTPPQTILFMVILSFVAALILAVLASVLKVPQETAQELDRSKEMLKAAQILNHEGYFQTKNEEGEYVPAKYIGDGKLEYVDGVVPAASDQILDIYSARIVPLLVNDKGELSTFKEAGINEMEYISDNKKYGYYKQPWKLIYKVLPNPTNGEEEKKAVGYIIPVNGMGLWDAIYGYLAIKPNGDSVIGISWYEQKETPGLGANIADWDWQKDFPGKVIFQPSPDGQTDFKTAQLGIIVVRGKVAEVYGASPRAKNAVDGMAGATLTGNGVTDAYKTVLAAYRPFLLKLHEENNDK